MAAGGQPTWLEKSHPPTPTDTEHSVPTEQPGTAWLTPAHVQPTVAVPALLAPPVPVPVVVDRPIETCAGSAVASGPLGQVRDNRGVQD